MQEAIERKNLSSFLYVNLKIINTNKRKREGSQEGIIKKNKHKHKRFIYLLIIGTID